MSELSNGIKKHTSKSHKTIPLKVEYIREFEAICKKALTCESGAQVVLFDEKNQRSKNS
jgi:hypothetical protein